MVSELLVTSARAKASHLEVTLEIRAGKRVLAGDKEGREGGGRDDSRFEELEDLRPSTT